MIARGTNPVRGDDGAARLRLAPVSAESRPPRIASADDQRADDEDAVIEAARRRRRCGRNDPVPLIRCGLANLYARSGRLDDARREIDLLSARGFAALERDHTWLASLAFLGEACAIVCDRARATALYDLLMPHEAELVVVTHPAAHYEGSVARILGLLAALLERWADARRHFERAIALDQRMGAPSFVARSQCEYARMLLARVSGGNRPIDPGWPGPNAALRLLSASIETMTRLRMEEWLRQAVSPHDQAAEGPVPFSSPTPRPAAAAAGSDEEQALFLDEGPYWTIRWAGSTTRMRSSKGLRYIALLLGQPGREVHSLEIVGCAGGHGFAAGGIETLLFEDGGLQVNGFGDSGEHLDEAAKTAYKRRWTELRREIEEARTIHDASRRKRLQEELDFLSRELARGLGRGGRARRAGSAVERARVNVTRAISLALARITSQHPLLGAHLARTIRTGTFCSYAPDFRGPIEWQL